MRFHRRLLGYFYIVLSALIFGCMPLMAKHLYADGVNSMTLVALRNLICLPFLGIIACIKRESFSARVRDVSTVLTVGIFGCALTPILLFSSYYYMNSGTATVLHFVYPAAVLLLELVLVRGSVRREGVIALLLCIVGIAFFYNPAEGIDLFGSVLALSSGLTYAAYIFLLGRIGTRGMGSFVFTFYTTLGAAVFVFAVCLISGSLSLPRTLGGWLLCTVFSLAVNIGAVMLFQGGTFIIGGQKASILSTFEPITSLIVGYFAFSERITVLSAIGALLVLSASVITAVWGEKRAAEEKEENQSCEEKQ